MPTILQRCRTYLFPDSSNFPSPTSSFPHQYLKVHALGKAIQRKGGQCYNWYTPICIIRAYFLF